MPFDEEILKELKKISKIVTLANGQQLEAALATYATNEDRKKIWVLIDGKRQPDDIVKASGLKKSAVYGFLKILEDSELIERQHGRPPKRLLEYVPAKWVAMIQVEPDSAEKETPPTPNQTQQEAASNV